MQGTAEAAPSKRRIFRDALSGDRHDFTEGSLTRGIALLAIPTVLEMAMESTFGLVDAFWVARLGADAIAAVGLTESLIVMIFSIAAGLSMAATATVARRIGEKDPEGASVAAVQAISLRSRHRRHHGHLRDSLCAAVAGADGRVIRRGGGGLALHAHHARRQRVHPDAVPDQRRIPRRRATL